MSTGRGGDAPADCLAAPAFTAPPAAEPLLCEPLGRQRLSTTTEARRADHVAAAFGLAELDPHFDGTWSWDFRDHTLRFSRAARQVLQPRLGPLPADEARFLELLPDDDRQVLLLALLTLRRGGRSFSIELECGPEAAPVRMHWCARPAGGNSDLVAGTLRLL